VEVETAVAAEAEAEVEEAAEPVVAPVAELDDLSKPLIEFESPKKEEEEEPSIVVVRPAAKSETEEETADKRRGRKGRQLVYDEELGEVVAKRKRKGSRRREAWEDFDIENMDEEF